MLLRFGKDQLTPEVAVRGKYFSISYGKFFHADMNSKITRTVILIFIYFLFCAEVKAQWFRCHLPNSLCIPAYIITQPSSPLPACPNSATISFSISVGGTGPFIYKWRENGILLSDSGIYSGTNTSTLILTNPSADMDGKIYRCQVSNCSALLIQSDPDVLIIHTDITDVNGDGLTDNQDFSMLNLIYNSSCLNCREDINADGSIDVKDFLQLLGAFNTACQ